MKKTKKALASLAIAGMTLSMLPFNAFAASTVPTRLAGGTAAQTAVAIAEQTGWTGTAILASSASYGMVDALTSGPLATFLKAPILLQEPGAVLNADTKAELTKLNVKKVYVTSGTSVISQAVLDQMTAMGISVESLGGADRFETSVNIAKKMVALGAPVSKVAVAYGWLNQDALSIASIASASSSPILLTEKNALPASVQAFLTANTSVTASDVIGGTGVISDAVKAALPNATRHAGNTAYDTNNQVIQDFDSSLTYGNVFVASGVTGIDALAGAPLAAASKSAIVLTDGTAPAAATFVHSKLTADSVVTALGGTAVVPETVSNAVRTGVVTPPTADLSVTSVSAVTANSFKVVFNQAPADISKVTFAVTQATTPVTVSTTWNTAKTEATLTGSVNFPEGSYTVAVKNDATDLGTSTLAITQQKIAKINITSTKLSISGNYDADPTKNKQRGYLTYNIQDQYGNDITTSYLANNLNFQSGVISSYSAKNGVLTITPNINLIQFSQVVVTAYESTNGVSASATLTTSTALGTLSNMTLNSISNVDGKVLTAGDDASVFYIDYTATDISGNTTKDYNLVKSGLILTGTDELTNSASSYVTAKVVQDPSDSNKAAIQVQVKSGVDVSMDIPVSITAMTYSGTSSTFNTTLEKASKAETFTVMAPTYNIAVGEVKEIPFVAYDQNGVQLTKASDLTDVTFSPANDGTHLKLTTRVDGTAALMVGPFASDGPQVITAMTTAGKLSSVTLNIQKPAVADTLNLDNSVIVGAMEAGSAQSVDFGYNFGGLSALDQYGRTMDLVKTTADYEVLATTSGSITVDGYAPDKKTATGAPLAFGGSGIKITAGSAGAGAVTFNLVKKSDVTSIGALTLKAQIEAGDTSKVISSKTATLSIIAPKDIKGYTMDTVTAPIYVNPTLAVTDTITGQASAYEANPCVYGKTSSGTKVLLAGTPIIGAYVDNTTDFITDDGVGPVAYDGVNVFAGKLGANVTSSSTNLTVTIQNDYDNSISSLSTPIKSSTVTPVASNIVAAIGSFMPGVLKDATGDKITINASDLTVGKSLARYDHSGSNTSRSPVYFYAVDSYGTKAMPLANVVVVSKTASFAVDQYGTVTTAASTGEKIVLSGITTNGLVKTIELDVN